MESSKKVNVAGGYDIVLVSLMPKKYRCPLCHLLMRAPVQTFRGERACETCYITATKNSDNICPIDEEEIEVQNGELFFNDNHARREVLQLQCYCPNKKSGCDWNGVINDIENHSASCLYKEISCTQCHDIICRKDVKEHNAIGCSFRIVPCPYCNVPYNAQSLKEHESTCHMKPLECPYKCGESILLNTLYNHVENCSKVLNGSVCPYQIVGCTYQPQNSSDLSCHMHIAAATHAAFTVSMVTALQNGNKKIRQDLLSEQNIRTEMATQIEEQNRQHAALETEMQKIKDKLYTVQTEGKNVQEKCQSTETKVKEDIKEIDLRIQQVSIESLDRRLDEMKTRYDELGVKINSGAIRRSSTSTTNSDELREVNEKVNQLERGSAIVSANLSDLQLKLQLFENTSYTGHQLWKVDNVMYRMNQAVTGKVTALHSAPCFHKMGGYKFCTRLYLNGDGMGRGTHVSLFFVVMKSEYDALLPWPFTERVSFRLINPYNREESQRESFIPDKNSSSFKRPQKDMNIAAGCPMFLRKEKLPQFILDDVIYIECTIGTENIH